MRPPVTDARRGTTLVELLVVFTIVAVLLGMGVGVFGKIGLMSATANQAAGVRALCRAIRAYARTHGAVGTVIVDVKGNRVVGLRERVVGQWHFENEERGPRGAFDYDPVLAGGAVLDPVGCIGGSIRLDGQQGSGALLGRSPAFVSEWGVSLSCDLFLDAPSQGTVVAMGDAFGLKVAGDGALTGWVGVGDGRPGARPDVIDAGSGEAKVPVGRWVRVGVHYDRVEVRVFIDYRPVGAAQERRPGAPDPDAALRVGGGGAIAGRVDGVRLAVLGPGDGGEMPPEVRVKGGTPVIRFNPDGMLDPLYHSVPAEIVLEGEDGRRETVTVGLMGDVGTG